MRFWCVLAVVLVGCEPEPPEWPPPVGWIEQCSSVAQASPQKKLKIVSINPSTVYLEGAEVVTVKTENGCGQGRMRISVDGELVAYRAVDLNTYTFAPPPHDFAIFTAVKVAMDCSAPPDTSFQYSCPEAEGVLNYDPKAEPAPRLDQHGPEGSGVATDTLMTVVFTRPIDPSTVTPETFGIEGVSGTRRVTADLRSATFTPLAPLEPAKTYRCFVTTGVLSTRTGKPLWPRVAPAGQEVAPDADRWDFTTRSKE